MGQFNAVAEEAKSETASPAKSTLGENGDTPLRDPSHRLTRENTPAGTPAKPTEAAALPPKPSAEQVPPKQVERVGEETPAVAQREE